MAAAARKSPAHPFQQADNIGSDRIKSAATNGGMGRGELLGGGGVVDDVVAAEMMDLCASNWAQHGAP